MFIFLIEVYRRHFHRQSCTHVPVPIDLEDVWRSHHLLDEVNPAIPVLNLPGKPISLLICQDDARFLAAVLQLPEYSYSIVFGHPP